MSLHRTAVVLIGALLVCSSVSLAIGGTPVAAPNENVSETTLPEDGPAYGVNSSDFYKLWSDDVDDAEIPEDALEDRENVSQEEFERALAESTDIPFEQPPAAPEIWNRGDLSDYNPGGSGASVAPSNAQLTDGAYIKDAFVSIGAIQSSTILHDTNETDPTQYIAPDGEVLAVTDYRVAIPDDREDEKREEEWSLVDTSLESVTLKANGETLSEADAHRSVLEYSDLSGSVNLSVETTISASLNVDKEICTDWNVTGGTCDEWSSIDDEIAVEQTVSDSRSVVVNELSNLSGNRVEFEAVPGQVGAVVNPDTEWSTITVDEDAQTRSNWWFYTAGTPGWNELVTHEADGSTTSPSSVRPVEVHAFPSEVAPYVSGTTADGSASMQIEEVWGEERTGPTLPSNIDLEPASPYSNADSVAFSSETIDAAALDEVTVDGIVRGQSETISLGRSQTVREATLSLTVQESNSSSATVQATVVDASTDEPVTAGQVKIGNQSVPLDASGEATITVSNPEHIVRGEYVPGKWWQTDHAYSSAEDTTIVRGDTFDFKAFVDLVVVTLLWFLPLSLLVFGLDYVTDGELVGLERNS
ncbi:hypothetical protein Halru_2813 [Halovivax ruber XH-70]|uniref:Uncharacterized protein n=1 Tax=Halovivax ruber (strain DSM 18193 / JCM 13892 / XH-70) TaxID=797302 RepID=L0IF52_HALRX|nr:hypothetical protein [Halovivax ruber]AGB17384.1 hypothetical protein Halru_2813 [Halovivax ruber XH-70]